MTEEFIDRWNDNADALRIAMRRLDLVIEQEKKLFAELNKLQNDLNACWDTISSLKKVIDEEGV